MISTDSKNTIHSHFVLPLLRSAAAQGYSPGIFLKGTGLSPEIINQPRVRFTADQYNSIVKKLWKTLDDENVGIGPRRVRMGFFELMCEVAMNSPDLEGVFRQLIKYYPVIIDFLKVDFCIQRDRAIFGFSFVDFVDEEHIPTEWTLFAWHRFACWLTGEAIPLLKISFNYPQPEYANEYRHLFGGPCYYDAPRAEIQFDAKYLHLPILKRKADLKDFIHRSPGVLLATPASERSCVTKIRRTLIQGNDGTLCFPSFEELARRFNMSTQTLRRRLKEEDTTYQSIKNEIRRDFAIDLLAHHDIPVYDVGVRVGFNEASGFSRAFKMWTGTSPSAYRDSALEI